MIKCTKANAVPCSITFAIGILYTTWPLLSANAANTSPVVQWQYIIGSGSGDLASGISYDGIGSVFVTGSTFGALGGANLGSQDAFVIKLSSSALPYGQGSSAAQHLTRVRMCRPTVWEMSF